MDPADDPELRFLGPLVSVENVEDHLPLLAHAFGLEPRGIQELDAGEVRALWGLQGRTAGSVLLETGESRVGVRLVQFARPEEDDPFETGPLIVASNGARDLRFLTRDFEVARHVIERAGFEMRSVARYSAPGLGRFTEARLAGPEGLSYAVLCLHDLQMDRYVRITDRLFGELLSVAVAVPDLERAAAFYELLGLRPVTVGSAPPHVVEEDGESVVELVSEVAEPKDRDSANSEGAGALSFGFGGRAPLVTLVPDASLRRSRLTLERALLGPRGVVALQFESASVEAIRERFESRAGRRVGARVLARGRGILEPHGAVESFLVMGPGGLVHQFLGPL